MTPSRFGIGTLPSVEAMTMLLPLLLRPKLWLRSMEMVIVWARTSTFTFFIGRDLPVLDIAVYSIGYYHRTPFRCYKNYPVYRYFATVSFYRFTVPLGNVGQRMCTILPYYMLNRTFYQTPAFHSTHTNRYNVSLMYSWLFTFFIWISSFQLFKFEEIKCWCDYDRIELNRM